MLKLFGRDRADHPLADFKAARHILAELPSEDSLFSLEEVTHWLLSVREEPLFRPEYRAQLVQLLDETGQAPARRLKREYLASPRQPKQQEQRVWPVVHAYWRELATAYVVAVEETQKDAELLPLFAVRALRAITAYYKWACMRYSPAEAALWDLVARVHRRIDKPAMAHALLKPYPGSTQDSNVEREMTRLLMFAACSPNSLTPRDMELSERLIAHFAPRFLLTAEPGQETPYWVDLGAGAAPHRGPLTEIRLGPICFFGAGPAYDALRIFKADLRTAGALPSGLNLGGDYEFAQIIAVIDHLESYWAPRLPERRYARQSMKSRLTVVHGFDGALDVLQPGAGVGFINEDIESWIVQNVSTGGFGAVVPQVKGDWLRVGYLVALQTEGSSQWSLGILKRLACLNAQQANVGIQSLSRAPVPVELRVMTEQSLSADIEVGIVLPALRVSEELRLILRPGVYAAGQMFVLEGPGVDRVLVPTRELERGIDYEILACRESKRGEHRAR